MNPFVEELDNDNRIRYECMRGTIRMAAAFLNAGHILCPETEPRIITQHTEDPHHTMQNIAIEVAKKHGITLGAILGNSHRRTEVTARTEAYRLCVKAGKTSEEIARFFKRDGSTIRYHICEKNKKRKKNEMRKRNKGYYSKDRKSWRDKSWARIKGVSCPVEPTC